MNFVPLTKRVLINPEKVKEVSDGGILLAASAQEKPVKGEVLAIAQDCENIKVGQIVLYGRYAGTSVDIEDEKYILLHEKEIYGILS